MRNTIIGLSAAALISSPALADDPSLPRCEPGYGQLVTTSRIDIPAVDAVGEVELGQSMVSSVRANVHESAAGLAMPITVEGRRVGKNWTLRIPAGRLRGMRTPTESYYEPAEFDFRYENDSQPRSRQTSPTVRVRVPGVGQPVSVDVNFGLGTSTFTSNVPIVQWKCLVYGADSFRRELLYSGVAQGTISLEYREFINDMARPAFSQTLRYDLNEGRTIGFRGARFEILDANNISVRYRVLRELE